MAFGLNRAEVIGRLGADVTVNQLTSGGRVANMSVATDESYLNKQTGERVDKTEWHRIVTFQDGLIDMLEKHAVKGRLVYVAGKLQTRRWSKPGEDGDRFSTEILLVPGGRVQFLDKPNGANGNGSGQPAAPASGAAMPAGGALGPGRRFRRSTSRSRHGISRCFQRVRLSSLPLGDRRFGVGPPFWRPLRVFPPPESEWSLTKRAHRSDRRESMARDSIFADGAVLVPDFVTPAEEARILLRIAEAPWLDRAPPPGAALRVPLQLPGHVPAGPGRAVSPLGGVRWPTGFARTSRARSRCSAS